MRFSMKWALAAMAYVAVAAAAFSRQTWVFADLLWAASLLAVVFATLVAAFARGRRQVAAAGFVVASGCFLLCMAFDQNAVPTNRMLAGAGIYASAPLAAAPTPVARYAAPQRVVTRRRPVNVTKMTENGPVSETRLVDYQVVETAAVPQPPVATAYATPTPLMPAAAPMTVGAWMAQPRYDLILPRSGRAVGMMVFGLLGCVVGLLAHKATRGNLDHCVA
jgi:hypothetical protein